MREPESDPPGEPVLAPGTVSFEEAGFVPPDPDEPPPLELWRAVGDVAPFGTMLLLLAWAIVFALLSATHATEDATSLLAHGASVTQRDAGDAAWRLLASTFLHSGPAHIFFNALFMLVFGPAVERLFTRWSFWVVYAGGGAAASLASLLWRLSRYGVGPHISVGASGAIFALGGALLAAAWRLRARLAVGRARALGAAILFLATQSLVGGFAQHGTDNAAHAGGLLAGVLLGAVMPLREALTGRPAGRWAVVPGVLAAAALAGAFVMALGEH